MNYRYGYPHPAVTVDACVFLRQDDGLRVLLVRRGRPPFEGQWSLPGGFVGIDESLDAAVHRELAEETGLAGLRLEQLRAFGDVDRDPRERVISIAYIGLIDCPAPAVCGGDDADGAAWFPVSDLPPLAFDHAAIIRVALARVEA
jgi:8-oxo-dGTP diphosphatase